MARNPKTGRQFPAQAYVVKKYRKGVALLIAEAGYTDVFKGYKGRVMVSCKWFGSLQADISNFHDELNDALKGPLGKDDRDFLTHDLNRFRDLENPRVELWIEPRPDLDAEAERYAERLRKERKRRRKEAKE